MSVPCCMYSSCIADHVIVVHGFAKPIAPIGAWLQGHGCGCVDASILWHVMGVMTIMQTAFPLGSAAAGAVAAYWRQFRLINIIMRTPSLLRALPGC